MDAAETRTAAARRIQQLLITSSPLIEQYTAAVCPSCREVCCKQRHGMFTENDRAYLSALGAVVPQHDPAWPLDKACQFLGPTGCAKPRWQRAWKCTWFFCDPLLRALDDGPGKQARALTQILEEIITCYSTVKG